MRKVAFEKLATARKLLATKMREMAQACDWNRQKRWFDDYLIRKDNKDSPLKIIR